MDRVTIIGSGNVGANAAFFIAEKGVADVTLYDIPVLKKLLSSNCQMKKDGHLIDQHRQ